MLSASTIRGLNASNHRLSSWPLSLSLSHSPIQIPNPKPKQLRLSLLLSLSSFRLLSTLSSSHPSRRCTILSIVFINPPKPSSLHRRHQITRAIVGALDSHHLLEKHLSLSLVQVSDHLTYHNKNCSRCQRRLTIWISETERNKTNYFTHVITVAVSLDGVCQQIEVMELEDSLKEKCKWTMCTSTMTSSNM
ncbi:hypothetical protein LOK49_LG07G00929 [Camellia lanceoleosa]|uniref:Uncharacterized protein n=1 Tax=Camellia lanceoleosa TaxID=1840588 RepID=A0ACC0H410_9ERIC|nr:hypothetical protein LOK49_LG07G00929 [Camellia lanceoleosa]